MTCEDCIYFDKCCADDVDFEFYALNTKEETKCQLFKDKSKFVELPCKPGDTVYRLAKWDKGKIVEFTVEEIDIFNDEVNIYDDSGNDIYKEDIGRTVFFTRKEAEAKLKELESE